MATIASPLQVRSLAKLLKDRKGTEGAIEYCNLKMSQYEERIKSAPHTFNGISEKETCQIMIDFYLAVSLMIQTI